jgi:hypothetical protein
VSRVCDENDNFGRCTITIVRLHWILARKPVREGASLEKASARPGGDFLQVLVRPTLGCSCFGQVRLVDQTGCPRIIQTFD